MFASVSLPAFRSDRRPALSVTGWLRTLAARRRSRDDLRRLLKTADHLLTDIGLDPQEVAAEAAKPFWRR